MSRVGDAHQVERLAIAYQRAAHQLFRVGEEADQRLRDALWRSPAASHMQRRAEVYQRLCRYKADEMQSMAQDLRRHALWIRQTEAELRRLEQRIRAWASAHPPRPDSPGPDARIIRWWPPPLDFAWQDLASQLRRHGVAF